MTATHTDRPFSVEEFDIAEFAAEMIVGRSNAEVGSTILYENNWTRIWDITLEPGERVPFHCHSYTYWWVCEEAGDCALRTPDGKRAHYRYDVGDFRWCDIDPQMPVVHDLVNTGTTRTRFTTTEILLPPSEPVSAPTVHRYNPGSIMDERPLPPQVDIKLFTELAADWAAKHGALS
jgi:beta-alanine degradation protein BauB